MAIALGLNPAWKTQASAPSAFVTTAFSPLANSLIIIDSHCDGTQASLSPTIADSVGLTWTAIGTAQRGVSGGFTMSWWAYTATARTNMTATVTWGTAATKAIKATTYTGTATTSAVISKVSGNSATNNLTVNVTTTNAGCRIRGNSLDWNALGLPVSTDDETAYHVASQISGMIVHKAADTAVAGTSVSLNFDAFGTAAAGWGYKISEILPAAGGTTDVAGSDTGSGTDGTATLDAALTPATDAETAVDAGTLLASFTPATDVSSMIDTGTLLASFSGTEAGASADAPSGPLSAILTGADTGTRVEAYQLSVVLQSVDTGAGADAGSVGIGVTDKSGAETATAVDAATLAASQTRADTAGAADVATLVVNFTASELSSIVDTVQALAAAHQGADTSSQTEGQTVNAGGAVSGGDTSSVIEGRTLTVSLTGADTSTTTENQTVLPTIPQSGSDTASLSAENRTLAVQLTASEIVAAVDAMFSLSAGGNPAGIDAGAVVEQIQLLVQVTGSDGVTSIEQGSFILFKASADTFTMVDSASLLAQLTVAEIVAAAEVLAVLTGPQTWQFVSADFSTVSTHEMGGSTSKTSGSSSSSSTGVSGSTSISMTISF